MVGPHQWWLLLGVPGISPLQIGALNFDFIAVVAVRLNLVKDFRTAAMRFERPIIEWHIGEVSSACHSSVRSCAFLFGFISYVGCFAQYIVGEAAIVSLDGSCVASKATPHRLHFSNAFF